MLWGEVVVVVVVVGEDDSHQMELLCLSLSLVVVSLKRRAHEKCKRRNFSRYSPRLPVCRATYTSRPVR